MADDLPIQSISITGATLASIIQRFTSSPGDVDGLLFGHLTRLPPPDLPDDDDATPSSPIAATITGHFCSGSPMSFYDPLGQVYLPSLRRASARSLDPSGPCFIGWFSGRRRTPLRPSMRELAVCQSLSKTLMDPSIFLILSSSSTPDRAIHKHEYRVLVLSRAGSLVPMSLDVVNVGPAFRGQYGSFSPDSALPWVPLRVDEGERRVDEGEREGEERRPAKDQQVLDSSAEGFGMESLRRMVGDGAEGCAPGLENLYGKMLLKIQSLARQVEKSSAEVLEQEKRNVSLRSKLAGLE